MALVQLAVVTNMPTKVVDWHGFSGGVCDVYGDGSDGERGVDNDDGALLFRTALN